MKNVMTALAFMGLTTLGGCGGATLGEACEIAIDLCTTDLAEAARTTAVDACVDAAPDDIDSTEINCTADATTCDAVVACDTSGGDTDDTDTE